MNSAHRKPLPGTNFEYFDARAAVDALRPGAWDTLPYTSRVSAKTSRMTKQSSASDWTRTLAGRFTCA
jgi:hypothetical protein